MSTRKFSRRDFLKTTALGMAGLAVTASGLSVANAVSKNRTAPHSSRPNHPQHHRPLGGDFFGRHA